MSSFLSASIPYKPITARNFSTSFIVTGKTLVCEEVYIKKAGPHLNVTVHRFYLIDQQKCHSRLNKGAIAVGKNLREWNSFTTVTALTTHSKARLLKKCWQHNYQNYSFPEPRYKQKGVRKKSTLIPSIIVLARTPVDSNTSLNQINLSNVIAVSNCLN